MSVLVSVLTPSIPSRAAYLEQCRRSVLAQTYGQIEHLVEVDERRDGCATTMNRLAVQSKGEWLLPLADDDLLLPDFVQAHLDVAVDADVVYAPPLVWGVHDPWWFYQAPPAIPSCALIRTRLWRDLGGYREGLVREEDRDLWTRAMAAGARFVRAEGEPTWVYRIHHGSKSFHQGVAA